MGVANKIAFPAQIHELTAIRALAAAAVVFFHMFLDTDTANTFVRNLVFDGHLGLDLFFILSGFILTHVYLPLIPNRLIIDLWWPNFALRLI